MLVPAIVARSPLFQPGDAERGLAYIFVSLVASGLCVFGIGGYLLRPRVDAPADAANKAATEAASAAKARAQVDAATSVSLSLCGSSTGNTRSAQERIIQAVHDNAAFEAATLRRRQRSADVSLPPIQCSERRHTYDVGTQLAAPPRTVTPTLSLPQSATPVRISYWDPCCAVSNMLPMMRSASVSSTGLPCMVRDDSGSVPVLPQGREVPPRSDCLSPWLQQSMFAGGAHVQLASYAHIEQLSNGLMPLRTSGSLGEMQCGAAPAPGIDAVELELSQHLPGSNGHESDQRKAHSKASARSALSSPRSVAAKSDADCGGGEAGGEHAAGRKHTCGMRASCACLQLLRSAWRRAGPIIKPALMNAPTLAVFLALFVGLVPQVCLPAFCAGHLRIGEMHKMRSLFPSALMFNVFLSPYQPKACTLQTRHCS